MVGGDQPSDPHTGGEPAPERPEASEEAVSIPGIDAPEVQRPPLGPYAVLLVLVISEFAIVGIAEPGGWQYTLLSALLGGTLVIALALASARRPVLIAAGVVAVTLFLATLVQALAGTVDARAFKISGAVVVSLAPFAIFLGVVRRLRATKTVTVDAVIGVVCVYILIGLFFGYLFGAIDRVSGIPFFAAGESATMAHCLYYSFTTIATVGYGDFTAASNLGHTLSVSEALLGQVYLVTVVSLIVGNLGRRRVR